MKRTFTGWHITAILLGAFAVVLAVNVLMATLALRGFSGVVVENSYVASQNFNTWLDTAKRQKDMGWTAKPQRNPLGELEVVTNGVPDDAKVTAEIRRPVGRPEHTTVALDRADVGSFVSRSALPAGRWIVRIAIDHGADKWRQETEIG